VQGEVRHHLDFDPGYRPLEWSARGLGAPARLVQLAALVAVSRAWPRDMPTPGDEPSLLALVEAIRPGLFDAARTALAWMDSASRASERLEAELSRPAPAEWGGVIEATREDRAWLLDPERLETLEAARLDRVPALLSACADRLRRLGGGGLGTVVQGLATFDVWTERARGPWPREASAEERDGFLWSVREARLGLFAREGGPWPRARDLEAAWSARSRSPTA
jgi:hypothetical protein